MLSKEFLKFYIELLAREFDVLEFNVDSFDGWENDRQLLKLQVQKLLFLVQSLLNNLEVVYNA